MKNNKKIAVALSSSFLCLAVPVMALESMSDGELSDMTAQDGVSITLEGPLISADNVRWTPNAASHLSFDGISISSVALDGTPTGGPLSIVNQFDAGIVGGAPGLSYKVDWSRMRLKADGISLGSSISNSLFSLALDSSGSFSLFNQGGLFNTSYASAGFSLAVNDASLFLQQGADGSPELTLHNLDFLWDMPVGIVGIDSEGILVEGDVNFNLTFDILHEAAPVSAFSYDAATDLPTLHYGWGGDLVDAQLRIRPGGSWLETSTIPVAGGDIYDQSAKTEGLNLSVRFDYGPTFRWIVGEAAGNRKLLEFGSWTKLPGPGYGFNIPFLGIDVINAGEGPGGLCWGANWSGPAASCVAQGGQFLDVAPEDDTLAFLFRDFQLKAYSTSVKLIDAPNPDRDFTWGLIYTWGNVDGNIYLNSTGDNQMKADLLITNQTFDVNDLDSDGNVNEAGRDWNDGTHFMIADTDANLGIGFLHSGFLVAANDLTLSLAADGVNLATDQLRLAMTARFGGGDLPNLNEPVTIGDIDVNFEFDLFSYTLSPAPPGETYLAYDATFNFANTNIANFSENDSGGANDDGSYFAWSEPSRPESDIRLADIQGSIRFTNGKVDIRGDGESGPGLPPQLVFSNDIHIGTEVSGGQALVVNRIEFNNGNLGSFVIPQGQWHSTIALSPQY